MIEMEKAFRLMQISLDRFTKSRKKLIKAKDANQRQILETQRFIKTEVIDTNEEVELLKETLKKQDIKLKVAEKLLKNMLDKRNSK